MKRKKILLNKPRCVYFHQTHFFLFYLLIVRYVGMAILSISKEVMYDFHYNFIHKHFPGVLLGFTDTDSFMYSLPCEEDIYQKLKDLDPDGEWMDFSNYPGGWCDNQERNRLVPGKFKDEGAGIDLKIMKIKADISFRFTIY